MIFPRGSEWRKWDLHVHTPASALDHSLGDNWDKYVDDLIEAINKHGISAIATADYFTIEGYRNLLKYYDSESLKLARNGKEATVFIIPGVELRLNNFNSDQESINVHVLFNPKLCNPTFIEEKFLEELEIEYRGRKYKLKEQDILAIGKSILDHEEINITTDFSSTDIVRKKAYRKSALKCVSFSKKEINEALKIIDDIFDSQKLPEKPYMMGIAGKGYGGIRSLKWFEDKHPTVFSRAGLIREDITHQADFIFSNDQADRIFYLGLNRSAQENEIRRRFGSTKPCVWGSDSHSINNLLHPSSGATSDYTWIKADLTFEGLKQIMIEPEDRIYIGLEPEKLKKVRENKTKYLRSVKLSKLEGSVISEKWFESITPSKEIFLNHDLVAVIGNKGSGKSALADILALLGSARNYHLYSFLKPEKFRMSSGKLAKHFESAIVWESGEPRSLRLDENPQDDEPKKITYIPQKFFELKCNEDDEEFEKEIKDVIFSYIKENERYKKNDLDELMRFITEPIDSKIELIKKNIKKLNENIYSFENITTSQNISYIGKVIEEKKKELENIKEQAPKPKPKPDESENISAEMKKNSALVEALKKEQEELIVKKNDLLALKALHQEKIICADRLADELQNIFKIVTEFKENYKADFEKLGLDPDGLVSLQVDSKKIEEIKKTNLQSIDEIDKTLNLSGDLNLDSKLKLIKEKIQDLESKLSAPLQKYLLYQQDLKKWENNKDLILGDATKEGSLRYYEAELKRITEEVPSKIQELKTQRIQKSSELYSALEEKLSKYKSLFSEVEKSLTEYKAILDDKLPPLNFSASIKETRIDEKSLLDWFFSYVSQARGAFHDNGFSTFLNFLRGFDLSKKEQCIGFIEGLVDRLEYVYRDDKKVLDEQTHIFESIKTKSKDKLAELYDGLFCLSFIEPTFSLQLGKKNLSQLSPGEKGAVLLVFYLLLDQDDIPLIIDQPEENLDNQSIFETLVPIIKLAKTKRQVVMVTHNPNLAVVCDAEQIIRARIDKEDANKVTYISGSIENPEINENIVDVLEGTFPAFENREKKYMNLLS